MFLRCPCSYVDFWDENAFVRCSLFEKTIKRLAKSVIYPTLCATTPIFAKRLYLLFAFSCGGSYFIAGLRCARGSTARRVSVSHELRPLEISTYFCIAFIIISVQFTALLHTFSMFLSSTLFALFFNVKAYPVRTRITKKGGGNLYPPALIIDGPRGKDRSSPTSPHS